MSEIPSNIFTLNGVNYDSLQLTPEGQEVFGLLNDAQNELNRLGKQTALIQAAQQQLINQLKPMLPSPVLSPPLGSISSLVGHASKEIPTTPAEKPSEEPAPFPDNIQT